MGTHWAFHRYEKRDVDLSQPKEWRSPTEHSGMTKGRINPKTCIQPYKRRYLQALIVVSMFISGFRRLNPAPRGWSPGSHPELNLYMAPESWRKSHSTGLMKSLLLYLIQLHRWLLVMDQGVEEREQWWGLPTTREPNAVLCSSPNFLSLSKTGRLSSL